MTTNKFIFQVYVGENGNWYINDTDTGAKAQGEQGEKGITPHIGINGNWFIGETDTQVPVTGPKGDTGAVGPQGIQGPKGEKGEQGPADPVNIANNLDTMEEGYALDARQGKLLDEKINQIFSDFSIISPMVQKLYQLMHPVGSIVIQTVETNPSELYGGTWVAWGNGRVPVGIDKGQIEFNAAEKTGGMKKHTLTIDELPNHNHAIVNKRYATTFSTGGTGHEPLQTTGNRSWTNISDEDISTAFAGSNASHNNLQPYVTCYMWKRTA